jgi:hypothetical protein
MASATSAAKTAPKKVKAPTNHPSTLEMVQDAIQAMHDPKGVPAVRIKSYICEKYKEIDPNSLKYRLRQALKKGIEKEVIIQSKSTAEKPVLISRFKLVKQKPEKKEKEKKPAEPVKKAKPTTKVVKSATDKEKTTAKKSPKKTKAVTGKTNEKETKTKTKKVKTPVKKTATVQPKPKTAKPKVNYSNTCTTRQVY